MPDESELAEDVRIFAVLALGVVESLASGVTSAEEAVRDFFNAENCLFVDKQLKDKTACRIMGRGTQLPDLFDALPSKLARREFEQEVNAMRTLTLKLLKTKKRVT